MTENAIAIGLCWCGCGRQTKRSRMFIQTHDRKAESWLVKLRYRGIANMLASHGFDPRRNRLRDAARNAGLKGAE